MAGFTGGEMAFETGSNSYLQALRRATKEDCTCTCMSA